MASGTYDKEGILTTARTIVRYCDGDKTQERTIHLVSNDELGTISVHPVEVGLVGECRT